MPVDLTDGKLPSDEELERWLTQIPRTIVVIRQHGIYANYRSPQSLSQIEYRAVVQLAEAAPALAAEVLSLRARLKVPADVAEIVSQCRALSRHEHDDLTFAADAADALESQAARIAELDAVIAALKDKAHWRDKMEAEEDMRRRGFQTAGEP